MKKPIRIKDYDNIMKIINFYRDQNMDELVMSRGMFKRWQKDNKVLKAYIKKIQSIDKLDGNLKNNIMDIRHIIPPWLVYLNLNSKEDIINTEYYKTFLVFANTLSDMEKTVYKNWYNIPKEWEIAFY